METQTYTIEDLRDGKVALVNNGSAEDLSKVMKITFPNDLEINEGYFVYYFKGGFKDNWDCDNKTDLPTQSVKVFLKEIELEEVKEKAKNGVNITFKSKSTNDLKLESLKRVMETQLNIIPISMRCTQEQYKSIKPILDANGISNDFVFSHADTFLVTNYSDDIVVMNVLSIDAKKFGRTIFTEWDEEIFLRCLAIEPKDNINPSHYKRLPKETIERIQDNLTPEEFKGYLKGNILKYLDRYQDKNGVEDLKKANWYLNKLIEIENGN